MVCSCDIAFGWWCDQSRHLKWCFTGILQRIISVWSMSIFTQMPCHWIMSYRWRYSPGLGGSMVELHATKTADTSTSWAQGWRCWRIGKRWKKMCGKDWTHHRLVKKLRFWFLISCWMKRVSQWLEVSTTMPSSLCRSQIIENIKRWKVTQRPQQLDTASRLVEILEYPWRCKENWRGSPNTFGIIWGHSQIGDTLLKTFERSQQRPVATTSQKPNAGTPWDRRWSKLCFEHVGSLI